VHDKYWKPAATFAAGSSSCTQHSHINHHRTAKPTFNFYNKKKPQFQSPIPKTFIMQLSMLPSALLALLPLVSAGYSYGGSGSGTTTNSASTSGVASPATNGITVVNVGKNGLTMEPNDVSVPKGEIIEFHFFTGAHSVAQSAFDGPCTPLNATAGNGTEGFFSGAQSVQQGESANVFRVVSTGNPMWYYCATGKHCQNGMVGVVNKPASGQRTIQQYASRAALAASNVAPSAARGGDLVSAGSQTGTGTGSAATATRTPGSAGVNSLSGLSLPMLGLSAAAAAVAGLLL
jgi:hypothetical protein